MRLCQASVCGVTIFGSVLAAGSPIVVHAQQYPAAARGTRLAERWAWADTVSIGRCTKAISMKQGRQTIHVNTFRISRILRSGSQSRKAGRTVVDARASRPAKQGTDYILFEEADPKIGPPISIPFDDALLTYIRNAPSPAMAPSKRMPYFLSRLNSQNQLIANDALSELSTTAAKHYVTLPKAAVGVLERTVLAKNGTHGSDNIRLIAGYLLIKGTSGLDRFDAVLRSDAVAQRVLINSISAMDFLWRNGEGRIPQERLRQSLRLLLNRPQLFSRVCRLLTAWKDWSVTDRLGKLYGTRGYETNAAKSTIVLHLLSAEAHAPKNNTEKVPAFVTTARKHLARIQKQDPAQLAATRKRFNANTARRVTWRQGRLADPKIDKVATGLSGIPVKTSAVHVVRFHPDSKTLLAGSGDGTVRTWNVANGTRLSKFQPHSTWCFTLAHSADGERLATGGGDKLIRLYGTISRNRPNGGRVLYATLNGHTNDVHAVAFGPKREMLFSAGDDMVVHIWDLKTRTIRETLEGHTEAIPCLSVSPDGSLVATGSRDDSIRIWDTRTGKLQHLLDGHKNDVHSIAFSPDGKTLASASYDETVKLWDVATGNLRATFRDHANWVFSLAYSPDGKQIASADKDGRVLIWDAASGKKLAELRRQQHVSCVAFSADGQYLASSAPSGLIVLWNAKTRKSVRNLFAN